MRNKKNLSLFIAMIMVISSCFAMPMSTFAAADPNAMDLTILGTSDLHGSMTSWSYENGKDYNDKGLARVKTVVDTVKKENPNTVLIDNGDTIQGTILTDDLFNKNMAVKNPMIEMMGYMGYDAMTLGNHEFNFGLDVVEKMKKEAKFPILSANIYYKKDGSNFAKPYTIKTVNGVKVAILGLSVPTIRSWDASKVTSLEFKHMAEEAKKYVKILKEKEKVDVIVASVHAGLDSRHEEDGSDQAKMVAEACPELAVMLTGHDHSSVNTTVNGVLVAAPAAANGQMSEMVRFDLKLKKVGGNWTVENKVASAIDLKKVEASAEAMKVADPSHQTTLNFLKNIIGKATGDFAPASEIPGIPEAQVRDTAVIDIVNEVQMYYTNAQVAGAALFKSDSNLPQGDLNYANIFDIYKYPNTLVGVKVTGKQLKAYMEWSAKYFNTYKPGDLAVSFDPNIRSYNYDMFSGVTYKIDISKAPGSRIVNLMYGGKPVEDTQIIKLAINNYRYDGLKKEGILTAENEVYFNSDPNTLRAYIKDYIEMKKVVDPKVDNNWSLTGANYNHPLKEAAVLLVRSGKITLPKSADGRTDNVKSLNLEDLQKANLLPSAYVVTSSDSIESVSTKFNTTPERLIEVNRISKADFKAGISVYPPAEFIVPNIKKIDVLTVNDFHGNMEAGGSEPGAAKLTSYINYLRAINPAGTIVLNAGDAFQGTPMSNLLFGKPVVEMMNEAGFDAMTLGNHEFDWGIEKALETMKGAKFPLIVSNVYENGKAVDWAKPSTMLEKNGLKIGVIGLATVETSTAAHAKYVGKYEFKPAYETAQVQANELKKQGAQVVIALGHLPALQGASFNYGELLDTAAKTTGIDGYVGGHSHMNLQGFVKGKPYVEANKNGRNIGRISLYVDTTKNAVVYSTTSLLEVSKGGWDVAPNAKIADIVAANKKALDPIFGVVVGKAAAELKIVKNTEFALGNFIADAMRKSAGTDFCFTNEGGVRADMPAGNITMGTIFKIAPFDNVIYTGKMTGKQVKALLEQSAKSKVGYLQVSGLKFSFDSTKPEGQRLVSATLPNGTLIEDAKEYTVSTNDFLAPGGDGFTVFKEVKFTDTYMLMRDAMIEEIKKAGTIDPKVDGRMIDVSKKVSMIQEIIVKLIQFAS